MSQWHISIGGQQRGPYEEATLRGWHTAGRLPAETLVWAPHLGDWRSIGSVFGAGFSQPDLQPPPPVGSPFTAGMADTSAPTVAGTPHPSPHWTTGPSMRAVSTQVPLASLGRRLGAAALDVAIPYVVLLLAGLAGALLTAVLGESLGGVLAGLLVIAAFIVILVWPILSLGRLGQSYGKHLVGVKAVSARDGQPIGGGSACVRGVVSGIGLYVVGLGWLWALWDPQKQGWHDKAVGSVVVDVGTAQRVDPWTHLQAAFRGRW